MCMKSTELTINAPHILQLNLPRAKPTFYSTKIEHLMCVQVHQNCKEIIWLSSKQCLLLSLMDYSFTIMFHFPYGLVLVLYFDIFN